MIIEKYKEQLKRIVKLYCRAPDYVLDPVIDYSIKKRYHSDPVNIKNSYTHQNINMNLLRLTDWIMSKEPVVTAYGTMFRKHADSVNPLAVVTQQFLDARTAHKNKMFEFPKGTEQFEHYNLLQQLDKIDVNGR